MNFLDFFISPAHAQAAGGAGGGLLTFLPLLLMLGVMYFLFIRPQQKRVKEHAAMVEALKKGDEVVTNGGLGSEASDCYAFTQRHTKKSVKLLFTIALYDYMGPAIASGLVIVDSTP